MSEEIKASPRAGTVLYRCLLWMFKMDESNLRSKLSASSVAKARLKKLLSRVDTLLEGKASKLDERLRDCREEEEKMRLRLGALSTAQRALQLQWEGSQEDPLPDGEESSSLRESLRAAQRDQDEQWQRLEQVILRRNELLSALEESRRGREVIAMVVRGERITQPQGDGQQCDSAIWAAADSVLDERRFSALVLNELSALLVLRIQSERWVAEDSRGNNSSNSDTNRLSSGSSSSARFLDSRRSEEVDRETQLALLTMTVRKVLEIICRTVLRSQDVRNRHGRVWTTAEFLGAVAGIGVLESEQEVRVLCAILVQKGFVDFVYDEDAFAADPRVLAKHCSSRWQPQQMWRVCPSVAQAQSKAQKWTGNIMRYELHAPLNASAAQARFANKLKSSSASAYSCKGFLDKYSWWRVERSFWTFNGKTLHLLCFEDPSQKTLKAMFKLHSECTITHMGYELSNGRTPPQRKKGDKCYFQITFPSPQNDEDTLMLATYDDATRVKWLRALWLAGCSYPSHATYPPIHDATIQDSAFFDSWKTTLAELLPEEGENEQKKKKKKKKAKKKRDNSNNKYWEKENEEPGMENKDWNERSAYLAYKMSCSAMLQEAFARRRDALRSAGGGGLMDFKRSDTGGSTQSWHSGRGSTRSDSGSEAGSGVPWDFNAPQKASTQLRAFIAQLEAETGVEHALLSDNSSDGGLEDTLAEGETRVAHIVASRRGSVAESLATTENRDWLHALANRFLALFTRFYKRAGRASQANHTRLVRLARGDLFWFYDLVKSEMAACVEEDEEAMEWSETLSGRLVDIGSDTLWPLYFESCEEEETCLHAVVARLGFVPCARVLDLLHVGEDLWPQAQAPVHVVELFDALRGSITLLQDVLRHKNNEHSAADDPNRKHNSVEAKMAGIKGVAQQMCADVNAMPRHVIASSSSSSGGFVMTLEDFITLFAVCLVGLPDAEHVVANVRLVEDFLPGHHRASTSGYYFSALLAAVELLLQMDV